jgi:hypothetical protein
MATIARGWLTSDCFTRLSAALLILTGALAQPAKAVPISYELDVVGTNASGTFAGIPFSNGALVLTFEGDTTTVLPFTVQGSKGPTTGYVNLVGTATVTVIDTSNGTTVGGGTILSSAGIFISVDNTNGGIGFGSFGVLPGSANFPGQVAYPSGMLVEPATAVATYDLKGSARFMGFSIACVNFPATPCGAGIPLPTSAGELILNQETIAPAVFTATVQAVTPFSSLTAEAEVGARRFELEGHFSLGTTSNGINPLSEAVTLQLDSYSVTIPPGSFTRSKLGGYEFKGKIADVRLKFFLKADNPATYRFQVEGTGAGLPELTNPLSVEMTVGDDSGAATVRSEDR